MSHSPSPPRRRRWLLVPAALLVLLAAGTVWFAVRGSRAETEARRPSVVGVPVSQVYQDAKARPCVRAAILLPFTRQAVWRVVTDYADYGQFLPYVRDIEAEPVTGGVRMTGMAQSVLAGHWPFELVVTEEKGPESWRAQWEATGQDTVHLNRGGWEVVSVDASTTLLVLTLEAEVKGYPTFLLRNVFLHRLPRVLTAVERRLADHQAMSEAE